MPKVTYDAAVASKIGLVPAIVAESLVTTRDVCRKPEVELGIGKEFYLIALPVAKAYLDGIEDRLREVDSEC